MANATQGVYDLVSDVVQTLPKPYNENVIEDVCVAIEGNPQWHQRYQDLCTELRARVVNNWIGQYVKQIVGMETIRQVASTKSTLIGSYTKLRV